MKHTDRKDALQLPPKTCTTCGTTYERRRDTLGRLTEDPSAYRRRETCGKPACVQALRNTRGFTQRTPPKPRPCDFCGNPITPRPNDSPTKYEARKTCTAPACVSASRKRTHRSNKHNRARVTPPRPTPKPRAPCPICNTPRHTNRRKTCGNPTCITTLKKHGAAHNAWTPAEDTIIRDTYPTTNSITTAQALRDAGHNRTADATGNRARRLGLKTPTTPTNHQPAVLSIVTDYGGLPLTVEDVADELGIGQHSVKRYLRVLNEDGLIACRADPEWPSRKLYYAHGASAA